jgi:peptidoglycan/LPS O-acetylase OafA/YrhL
MAPSLTPLTALGRWSLTFYMLHQPILIAFVAGLAQMSRH